MEGNHLRVQNDSGVVNSQLTNLAFIHNPLVDFKLHHAIFDNLITCKPKNFEYRSKKSDKRSCTVGPPG